MVYLINIFDRKTIYMRNNLRLRMKRVMGAALLFLSIGIISANTLSLESNNDGTWNVNFLIDAG